MSYIVFFLGILLVVVALAILFAPRQLRRYLGLFQRKYWLWPATVIRIAFGLFFVFGAPDTRTPFIMWLLGLLLIANGMLIPFLGAQRMAAIAQWWTNSSDMVLRMLAVTPLLLGIFLMWTAH